MNNLLYYIIIGIGFLVLAYVFFGGKKKKQENKEPKDTADSETKKEEEPEEYIPDNKLPIGKITGKSYKRLIEEQKKKEIPDVFIDETEFEINPEDEQTETFKEYFKNILQNENSDNVKVVIEPVNENDTDDKETDEVIEDIEIQNENIKNDKNEINDFFSSVGKNIGKNKDFIENIDKIMTESKHPNTDDYSDINESI